VFSDSAGNFAVTHFSRFYKTIVTVINMHSYVEHEPLELITSLES